MAATEPATSGDLVFKPCARAFFVYYVAMALVLVGPRLNPAVGLPTWLGTLLGLIVLAAVLYQKYGTEYRATSRGVARVWLWPSRCLVGDPPGDYCPGRGAQEKYGNEYQATSGE